MPRQHNRVKTQQITVSFSEPVVEVLEKLAAGGYMGKNPSEVVEQLVQRELLRMRESGAIDIALFGAKK